MVLYTRQKGEKKKSIHSIEKNNFHINMQQTSIGIRHGRLPLYNLESLDEMNQTQKYLLH